MKIYTRGGDDGTTGLYGGQRVSKRAARVEAYGTVDELNASLGVARESVAGTPLDLALGRIQAELFSLGAELATPADAKPGLATTTVGTEEIERLEAEIDEWEAQLEPLACFILPGGSAGSAALHVVRAICRRVERRLVSLAEAEELSASSLAYVNRLSDYFFVAARTANRLAGAPDVPWQPPGS